MENDDSRMSTAGTAVYQKTLRVEAYDVAVVGGGTAGVCAAIASARTGARTVLIEQKGYLGGTVVEGGTALHSFYNVWGGWGREKVQVVRGIPAKIVDRATAAGACTGHHDVRMNLKYDCDCVVVDTELYKTVVHRMVEEAGVKILLNTQLGDIVCEDGSAGLAVCSGHGGLFAVKAAMFIDATAYGDVAAHAGAAYTDPNDMDAAASVGVGNVDLEKMFSYFQETGALVEYARAPRENGEEGLIRLSVDMSKLPAAFREENRDVLLSLMTTTTRDGYLMFLKINYRLPGSPEDPAVISAAELELRKRQQEAIRLLKKYIPGCGNAFITRSTPALTIRRGRCIRCDYDITLADITEARHFEDEVFEYGFHDEAPRYTVNNGSWYGFPYRAMLPVGLKNVYAVGMMITSDHHAHMSTRNTVSCMAMGQAAGTAAALCVKYGTETRTLPYELLRAQLIKDHVFLEH